MLSPQSIHEFVRLIRYHPDSQFVGGGTLVVSARKHARNPQPLVHVSGIRELHAAAPDCRGAASTMTDLAGDRHLPPAIREAAASIGGPAIRNWATLGGNVAAAAPGCLATVLLALDCRAEIMTRDGRALLVPLDEVIGCHRDLIVGIRWDPSRSVRFAKVRAGVLGPVTCSVAVSVDRARQDLRIAVGGTGMRPRRLETTGPVLDGSGSRQKIALILIERLIADISRGEWYESR
jgi:CO/xanthine dehydrogenase FAD-binding subunit